jgi:hypothetical protein
MPTEVFGVTLVGTTNGQAQSAEFTDSQEVAMSRDANGDIHNTVVYGDNNETMTHELVQDTSAAAIAAGDDITVNAKDYHITEHKISQSNSDFQKLTISGQRKVVNGTPQ